MKNFNVSNWTTTPQSDAHPVIVCSADENYAPCLAVTTVSMLSNCKKPRELTLVILDGGISAQSRDKLYTSWDRFGVDIRWIVPDIPDLESFPTSGHISKAAYFRIFLSDLLPPNFSKVLYLDSDLVIEGDIFELWETSLENWVCLAVQDPAAPYIDSQYAAKNYSRYWRILGASHPVANFRQLQLDPNSAYFNSGVMCINMDAWRENNTQAMLLKCLEENREHLLWWDQYLLNVVLHERWGRLHPKWNQTPHIFQFRDWRDSPFDQATMEAARSDPSIIHYASPIKPWQNYYYYPRQSNYFKYLDRTEWAGWRPKPALPKWQSIKESYLRPYRNRLIQRLANLSRDLGLRKGQVAN